MGGARWVCSLLPAFPRQEHECQDCLCPCDGIHVRTDLTSVHTLIRKSFFLWNGVRTHVNSKGEIPSTGGSEEGPTRDAASRRTASPTYYWLSYSGPDRYLRSAYFLGARQGYLKARTVLGLKRDDLLQLRLENKVRTRDAASQDSEPNTLRTGLFRPGLLPEKRLSFRSVVVCWLLNVPATCYCISGTDLLRQFYVLPHWDRSCRPNFPSHPVTVYWHRANQSQHWSYNTRRLAG